MKCANSLITLMSRIYFTLSSYLSDKIASASPLFVYIDIKLTVILCGQRHRMISDEFPENRNTKCMIAKLQNVTAFVVQNFIEILH